MAENGYPRIPLPLEMEDWLSDHPDERREEIEEVWQLTGLAGDPFTPDPAKVDRIRAELNDRTSAVEIGKRTIRITPLIWMAAAAVVVLGLGLVWVMQPVRYEAPVGRVLAVDLPDGSHVVLNSGSTLARPRLFGWRTRAVELTGEGFFDVSKGQGRFTVATFNCRLEVLGTRFNVRAWSGDVEAETSVFVEEGSVRLASLDNDLDFLVLEMGESGAVGVSSSPALRPNPDETVTSWRSGGMVFSDKPLRAILDEIERRYSVTVSLAPDSLERVHVSLHIMRPTDAQTTLQLLAAVHDLQLTETTNGYHLTTD